MNTGANASIAAIAAGQHAHFTLDQARVAGFSKSQIARNVATGRWLSPFAGVFTIAGSPVTAKSRLMAATLAAGVDAVASHRSAAWIHQLVDRPPTHPELLREAAFRSELCGVRVHLTKQLQPADCCVVAGIPVTTVPRTLLDLGAIWPFERVEIVTQDAIWPECRLSAEADGRRWHANAAQAKRDLRRSNAIQAAGWTHLRYGWDPIVREPETTTAELVAIYHARMA
jgi:hypothetical protein